MATHTPRPQLDDQHLQERSPPRPNDIPYQTLPVPVGWNLRYHALVKHPFINGIGYSDDYSPVNQLHVVEVFEVLKTFDCFWKCVDGLHLEGNLYMVQRRGDPRLILIDFEDMAQERLMQYYLDGWFDWQPAPSPGVTFRLMMVFNLVMGKWKLLCASSKTGAVARKARLDVLQYLWFKKTGSYLCLEMWDAIIKYK
jgi:hypothetical protein